MKKTLLTLIGLGASATLAYMYYEANQNRVLKQRLSFKDLPSSFDGYKIFFISDVHRRQLDSKMIDALKGECDLVIIGGDFVESTVPMARVEENILKLKQLADVYFVWGNNDVEVDVRKLTELFDKYNVHVLKNEQVKIQKGTAEIVLFGVDELDKPIDHLEVYSQLSAEAFTILISHFPIVESYLPNEHPFSLLLSGHTHGGQIRLFGLALEKLGTIKTDGSLTTLISNGYGTSILPLRLGAKSETHLLELKKSD
ncbi:hypothetical protein AJ85_13305 [Alkalihalobacillus alcalophilus ATCC 27647 = CGMCC 1.3604]|uniref:Calcineurin-like phosphoesterase domain-containing protein n=1 Tax=Alkalihalobacillus alcalophilus ATCC 27647 = CGMCC 1.3604 TaxID=1218173 RepID=A0A094WSY3_ALKAL|nr:metallophosphoesterase [Alkalihalobacillus alcalophilus]KGA99178.1 hypothetical protein BALCAV_0200555 [Alkalihalobacillus alcalophilus ATCC 27647 = CGMCC 1.3604]MED1561279.1 metallophosphoesterase family protein [Alkalihalobacillus alcalophilus]THG90092.1 hypothetical protein AJ85_13305 [Alkalihalobacillus alcalophilus ATCC 27647 = CGMCC 1.3604]